MPKIETLADLEKLAQNSNDGKVWGLEVFRVLKSYVSMGASIGNVIPTMLEKGMVKFNANDRARLITLVKNGIIYHAKKGNLKEIPPYGRALNALEKGLE